MQPATRITNPGECSQPFLKWLGGKRGLLAALRQLLPKGSRLIEPFVGAGAVFLGTDYPEYRLSDINPDLIGLYRMLQAEGGDFIESCRQYFNDAWCSAEGYLALRQRFNCSGDQAERAALFLYLNRHGFNGLCRYNQQGTFNVPWGKLLKVP